jgi:hypothetical protein
MTQFTYRLYNTMDPEERLEEAVMWKALHDVHGDNIEALMPDADPIPGTVFLGRAKKFEILGKEVDGIGMRPVRYWKDPAFLENCGRQFTTCDLKGAEEEVDRLHSEGKDAFVKAMRDKFYASKVPMGTSLAHHLEDLVYSFIDMGECLMVQEAVPMEFEQRFLFVEGELITSSPVQWSLTPAARLEPNHLFRFPNSKTSEHRPDLDLSDFAKEVAQATDHPVVGIDCAINADTGKPLVIEFNPLQVGQMGLYACDPWAIAEATKAPVFKSILVPGERPQPKAQEEIDEELWGERYEFAEGLKGI